MKLIWTTGTILGCLSGTLILATAANAAAPARSGTADKRTFNFEGDTLRTDALGPGGATIRAPAHGLRSSLIEVRLDFVREIQRSGDDI